MLRLAFALSLIWSVLCTGLVYECNFDGTKLKDGLEQNLSSSITPLTFARQLPLSRTLSHSCVIKTESKESFLHVKAKTYGATRGKLVCIPFISFRMLLVVYIPIEHNNLYHAKPKVAFEKQLHLMVKGFFSCYPLERSAYKMLLSVFLRGSF